MALFTDRARLADPDFELNQQTAPDVVRVCFAVGGIPLGVELAAAQLRHRKLTEVASMVESNLNQIQSPYRVTPDRQRTLAATVDWSYDLLPTASQQIFQQLSVFTGPLDEVAVADICQISEHDARDQMDLLFDHSLLSHSMGARRMLQPVRARAAELLILSERAQTLNDRHARFFLDEAAAAHDALRTPQQADWIRRMAAHDEDIRTAIRWGTGEDPEAAARAVVGVADFLFITEPLLNAVDLLEATRRLKGTSPLVQDQLDHQLARALNKDDSIRSIELASELIARTSNDHLRLAARVLLTFAYSDLGDVATARQLLVSSNEVDATDDPWLRVDARTRASIFAWAAGDLTGAVRYSEEAYELAVEIDAPFHIGMTANNLAVRQIGVRRKTRRGSSAGRLFARDSRLHRSPIRGDVDTGEQGRDPGSGRASRRSPAVWLRDLAGSRWKLGSHIAITCSRSKK